MGHRNVAIETREHIGILVLDRPDKHNALNTDYYKEIIHKLRDLDNRDEVYVILIRANGKNFCVGRDISEDFPSPWQRYHKSEVEGFVGLASLLMSMKKPVVAAVQGAAVAGGFGLAMGCDIVLASDDARFGLTAINVGLFCFGPSVPVSLVLGRRKTLELLFTGDLIDAKEAERLGLVNRVVPLKDLELESIKLTEKLATKSPIALQLGRQGFNAMSEMQYRYALEYAEQLSTILSSAGDAKEGMKAFLEKREPRWQRH